MSDNNTTLTEEEKIEASKKAMKEAKLKTAREAYFKKYGKNVTNFKKNDLEWINAELEKEPEEDKPELPPKTAKQEGIKPLYTDRMHALHAILNEKGIKFNLKLTEEQLEDLAK